MDLTRRERKALDQALATLDALTARVGAQGWRLTRSLNDNGGESLMLEVSLTGGKSVEWERMGWKYWFRGGRFHDTEALSLAALVAEKHAEFDKAVRIAALRSDDPTRGDE